MSFIYDGHPVLTGFTTMSLAINVIYRTGGPPFEHTPAPEDGTDLTLPNGGQSLAVADPQIPYALSAGRLSCPAAVWEHVYWDKAGYFHQGIPMDDGFTPQVVGVILRGVTGGSFALLDGPGFPFTPPVYDSGPGFHPPLPEFRVVWNPSGGDIIDFANPSGGQAGSVTWDDATKTMTIVPSTYHPVSHFAAHTLELVPPPRFAHPDPLIIPPVFGSGVKSSPEPIVHLSSLVIPPVFGGLTVNPGNPNDVPPDSGPPAGGDPYGPPEGRPSVDSGDAVPGADVTGRSGAMRVSRVRVMGR